MEQTNHSLSIARPAPLPLAERIGTGLLATGLLAVLVTILSADVHPLLPLSLGLTSLVVAAVLMSKTRFRFKRPRPGAESNKAGILDALHADKSQHYLGMRVSATPAAPQASIIIGLVVLGIASLSFLILKFEFPAAVATPLILGSVILGAGILYWHRFGRNMPGIRNNQVMHRQSTRKNGVVAWFIAVLLTGFYVILYWADEQLVGLIRALDPLSHLIRDVPADQWFLYGTFYSLAVLVMGFRFILKYRHNRYQIIRTISVTFFQLIVAFLLPYFLEALNRNEQLPYSTHYFSYFWPLDYDAFWPDTLKAMQGSGGFGSFVMVWSVVIALVAVPVLTFFFGKRWYCSWVCGCGGLAETAGDPFRHLSNKSLTAWRIERILIHSVLVLITLVTIVLLVQWQWPGALGLSEAFANTLKSAYGFVIASTFAGVIGVGFYPLMGSRVWCRFGCPQAAILGILQKWFSRFRITTNGGQCISCGNCSTYCEMGIDVKWYAQRGQNIVRASCVGCGICAAVCPRGVLRLESGPIKGKTSFHLDRDELKVLTHG